YPPTSPKHFTRACAADGGPCRKVRSFHRRQGECLLCATRDSGEDSGRGGSVDCFGQGGGAAKSCLIRKELRDFEKRSKSVAPVGSEDFVGSGAGDAED